MSDPTFRHDFSLTFSVRSTRAQASDLTDREILDGFTERLRQAAEEGPITPDRIRSIFQHVETTSLDAP